MPEPDVDFVIECDHRDADEQSAVPVGDVPYLLISIDEVDPAMKIGIETGGGVPDDLSEIADFLGLIARALADAAERVSDE